MDAIEAKSLTKKFGDFTAVDNISFAVGKGEFFGFVGPNGAGKTTTINMLATLLSPTKGTATVNGFNPSLLKTPTVRLGKFIAFPIVMLSGAIFPLHNLPLWLDILTKINPITYAVDILRRIVFEDLNLPPQAIATLSPSINGHIVNVGYEIAIVSGFTLILIVLASKAFRNA